MLDLGVSKNIVKTSTKGVSSTSNTEGGSVFSLTAEEGEKKSVGFLELFNTMLADKEATTKAKATTKNATKNANGGLNGSLSDGKLTTKESSLFLQNGNLALNSKNIESKFAQMTITQGTLFKTASLQLEQNALAKSANQKNLQNTLEGIAKEALKLNLNLSKISLSNSQGVSKEIKNFDSLNAFKASLKDTQGIDLQSFINQKSQKSTTATKAKVTQADLQDLLASVKDTKKTTKNATANTKESLSQEALNLRDAKGIKDSKDSKIKDTKEAKIAKETLINQEASKAEPKTTKELYSKSAKIAKDSLEEAREAKEIKDTKDTKETKATKEIAQEAKEVKEAKVIKEAEVTKEVKDTKATKLKEEQQEASKAEVKGAREAVSKEVETHTQNLSKDAEVAKKAAEVKKQRLEEQKSINESIDKGAQQKYNQKLSANSANSQQNREQNSQSFNSGQSQNALFTSNTQQGESQVQKSSSEILDNLFSFGAKTQGAKAQVLNTLQKEATPKSTTETKAGESSRADVLLGTQGMRFDPTTFNARSTLSYFSERLFESAQNYKPPVTKLSLELNPENLGSVELTLTKIGKELHIKIGSNSEALRLLAQNSEEFKKELSKVGFDNIKMDFLENAEENGFNANANGGGQGGTNSQNNEENNEAMRFARNTNATLSKEEKVESYEAINTPLECRLVVSVYA